MVFQTNQLKAKTRLLASNDESDSAILEQENDLIQRIIQVTKSQHSEPFYRQAITKLGLGMVEEVFGEFKYQLAKPNGMIKDAAKYFTSLLSRELQTEPQTNDALSNAGDLQTSKGKASTFMSPTALELFEELKPREAVPTDRGENRTMDFYSKTAIPWATFAGPEFFTLSNDTDKKSDTVIARFRSLDGQVTMAPLIRGKNSPDGREYGVLTVEHGRVLAALEYLWLRQGAKYTVFAGGRVLAYVDVSIREIAGHLGRKSKGGESFGGKDLKFLKRLLTDLKTIPYYIALEKVDMATGIRRKGFSFNFLSEASIVDLALKQRAETIVRVEFSDQYSRQLLQRRVVTRPLEIMTIRNEMAWLIRLYLEPILMGRESGEHSIELLNLIDIIHFPRQKWQSYKSQRRHVISKAVMALNDMKTIDGRRFHVSIEQGLNQKDYMLVSNLVGEPEPLPAIQPGPVAVAAKA